MNKHVKQRATTTVIAVRTKLSRTIQLFLLLFFLSSQVFASTVAAQSVNVKLALSNTSVANVIEKLHRQTGYEFSYDAEILSEKLKDVSVDVKNERIETVLSLIFEESDINFRVLNNRVFLKSNRKPEVTNAPAVEKRQQQSGKTITGTIVDSHGEPIIGATIIEKGNPSNGTISDIDGNFSLNVSPDAVLHVTYVGYESQELGTTGKNSLSIVLQEDTKALEEVVVVGYGTMKKKDLTGAVSSIKADRLNTQSNANLGQALQGKIAGVEIVSQGGAPGAGTRIMVRGIGTLNNSSPLYIVDGMYMSSIDNINPNDIASIDVLKDASSAAIYGSRAANGVVIITTKEGTNTDGKPIVDLSMNIGVSSPSKYLKMLDAAGWAKVSSKSREEIGKSPLEMAADLGNKPNNDWQRIMLGNATMQNYNASIRGGGKNATYYTSLGYFNQDGTVKGTNYQRYTIQSKNDYKKGIFSAGTNLILSMDRNNPLHEESRGGMLGTILQSLPTMKTYDDARLGGYGGTYGDVTNLPNPLGMVDPKLMDRYAANQKIFANIYASLEFMEGLKYKLNFTPDFNFYRYRYYQGKFDFGLTKNDINSVTEQQRRSSNLLVENLLTYDRTFGVHKVSALTGYSYQDNGFRQLEARGEELPEGLKEIDATTKNRTNSGYSLRSVLISVLGRVFYSYNDKYLITATIRRDESSKFAKNNRVGYFPSVSLGWNIAQEKFMENISWLDQLKIRGGYGELGNQEIENYQYTSTITTGINYPDGKGGLIQGAFPKDFANPNIKWETTTMSNIGVDMTAFRNRLTFTADYYIKNTKDILLTVPIPISTGGANDPVRNAGKIQNKGFEFNLGWNDRTGKEFSYGVNLIGNFNKNKVTQMGSGTQAIWGGATVQNINTSQTLAGYPIAGFWLIPSAGYFNSDEEANAYAKNGVKIQPAAKAGDVKFVDVNGDGVIDDKDRVFSGSPFPNFTFSINGNVAYKQFDAMIGLQGVFGNKIYNATRQTLEDVTKGTNYLASMLDYWRPDNMNAAHPRLTWDDPNRNSRAESNRYLEDGSYFRVRSIQVGYTLPASLFKGSIQHARVYINAENLFTFTKYKGYSPDVNTDDSRYRGFDYFIYPNNRVFMVGVNVSF